MINWQVICLIIMIICIVIAFIYGYIKHEGTMCLFYILAVVSFLVSMLCPRDVRNKNIYATIKFGDNIIINDKKVEKINKGRFNTEVWFIDGVKYEVNNSNIIIVDKKNIENSK